MARIVEADAQQAPDVRHKRMSRLPQGGWHQPVMVDEVLSLLSPKPGEVIVDGTAGTGGHSLAILPKLIPDGRLIAIDRDASSLKVAEARLAEFSPMMTVVHDNFCRLPEILQRLGLAQGDGLLLDLGMSSPQVDEPQRGFSFLKEGPLDMRMNPQQGKTAADLVNRCSPQELEEMIRRFGEERFARRIAQQLGQARKTQAIETTTQLAEIIRQAVPVKARFGRLHPATRTFQALRMAVNDEMGSLETALSCLKDYLKPGGRAAIITFHSLEDRLVKQCFVQGKQAGLWRLLTKKPLQPSVEEIAQNPRARSAKLRAVERCG